MLQTLHGSVGIKRFGLGLISLKLDLLRLGYVYVPWWSLDIADQIDTPSNNKEVQDHGSILMLLELQKHA